MLQIELQTEDKRHVTWVKLPVFVTPPQAITWGARVFLRVADSPTVYAEAFTWAAPPVADELLGVVPDAPAT